MNVQPLQVNQEAARQALLTYKQHRNIYDKRDWQIERIYRAIAKGRAVISLNDAIRRAGIDELGRPRLAVMRADEEKCVCNSFQSDCIVFTNVRHSRAADSHFEIPWPDRTKHTYRTAVARLPRIPPQYRPPANLLHNYHLLWEADWEDVPRDPYLLKRIARDAFLVCAAWELTDVEMLVMRQ